jgi:hypothetical protein
MPEAPKLIQYYYKEDTNQILVSGSATASDPLTVDKMNTLLNASKNPETTFDSEFTSKISSLGANVSYVVQNGVGAADYVIPIASDQELWVYRGYNTVGGDGLTYRYNPHIHRPYKAYILTETGSGVPNSPWLNLGTLYYGSYTQAIPGSDLQFTVGNNKLISIEDSLLPSSTLGDIAYELGINGNYINPENDSTTYPAPNGLIYTASISGSFTVYGENRQIHPWVFTRYTNNGGISTLNGSAIYIYEEDVISSTYNQSFDTNTVITTAPSTGEIKFNSSTAASITKIALSELENVSSGNSLSLDSKMTNLEGITTDKDLGKIHISSSATNFLSLNITDAVSIGDGNLLTNSTFTPPTYTVSTVVSLQLFDDTKYSTNGTGAGVTFGIASLYNFTVGSPTITIIKVNDSVGGSGWQTEEVITITAATLNANGFSGATGDLQFTVGNNNMDPLQTNYFYEIVGTLDSTSSPFTMFTDGVDLDFSFTGPFQQATLQQQQYYGPNTAPVQYPNNTLLNGYYTYTSSIFESTPGAGTGPSGSTQFGLYADLGQYISQVTQLETEAANGIRINFTANTGLPQFIDLEPGEKVKYTAVPGSVTFTGTYDPEFLTTTVLGANVSGEPTPDIFSTRWSDVYVSFSASNSSSVDGLYIFNQLPSNDVEITASMFLRSWTGSDAGPKYGDADYALSPSSPLYGEGETGEGPTWPTASMKIYTGSYPNNIPVIGDDVAYEVEFQNANIHVNGMAITMSFSIPKDDIALKDCLSLSLAVNSDQPLSEIENSLVVTEYNLEFNTVPLVSEGDGRVPTFIENAFEGTNGFSNTPDCQPLLNNAFTYRRNDQIQEVDYSTDIYTPINFQQILSGSALKSSVPASNYTSRTWTLPRYVGSRSTAERLNEAPTLQLDRFYTYGNIPVIDYQRAYFAYCEQVTDPYPVLNNKTQFNIKYLINEAGDANNPNLSPYTAFDIQGTWSPTTNPSSSEVGRVGMNQISGSTSYNLLNGFQTIDRVTQQAVPIIYSQTSSVGYSNFIPIRSRGVSSYTPPFTQYGMTYQGTVVDGNNAASKVITIPNILSQIINNPTGITQPDRYNSNVSSSIVSSSVTYANEGEVYFTTDPETITNPTDPTLPPTISGRTLSANYTLDFRGSFPSTVPQTYRTDAGGTWDKSDYNSGVIGTFQLEMEYNDSTNLNSTSWTRMSIQQTSDVILTCYFGGNQSLAINLFNAYGSSHVGFINNGRTLRVNMLGDATKNAITQAGLSIDNVTYTTLDVAIKNSPSEQLISRRRYRISTSQVYLTESVDAAKNFWNPITSPVVLGPFANMVVNPNQTDPDASLVDNALNAPYWEFPTSNIDGTQLVPTTQIPNATFFTIYTDTTSLKTVDDNLLAQANASSFNILGTTNFGEQTGISLVGGGDGNAVATITLTNATVMGNIQITNGGTDYAVGDVLTIPSASLGANTAGGTDLVMTVVEDNILIPVTSSTLSPTEYSVNPNLEPGTDYGSDFTIGLAVGTSNLTVLTVQTPGNNWVAGGALGNTIQIAKTTLEAKGFIITSANNFSTFVLAASNLNTIPLTAQIELQSSNGNTTYNDGYVMGTLIYEPSTSSRFPGGLEPDDTTFPNFNIQWNLEIGDEIRFVNDEAETYTIKAITTPDANTNAAKLLLVLDREVPASVDKDFFLLRRFVYEPSAIIVNSLFPYGDLASTTEFVPSTNSTTEYFTEAGVSTGSALASNASQSSEQSGSFVTTVDRLLKKNNTPSGFLFPEYPAPGIELEPDVIMRQLRDNKLIE